MNKWFASTGKVKPPSGDEIILAPVRKSLYDREQVWGGHMQVQFFQDCRQTADGRDKNATFTNMTQYGQLGYPLEFTAWSLAIKPVSADPEYVKWYERFIWSDYVLRWITGAQTIFNEQPISILPIRGYRPRKDGGIEYPRGLSGRLLTRVMDLRDSVGQPRHLGPTECFKAEVFRKEGLAVAGPPIDIYMCLEGILYTSIS